MMETLFMAIAIAILLSLILGLVRVVGGDEPVDRMMAAQLLGTAGVGILVALAAATGEVVLVDVALVFAALAAVAVVAFVHRIGRAGEGPRDD